MRKNYARAGFTPAQKAELWERWRRGEQMKLIGRAIGKRSSSIFSHIRSTGGFTPVPRQRSRLALTLAEREEISRGPAAGQSMRMIAYLLERSPSTICREIKRNGGAHHYRAEKADKRAWKQALRPKLCKLAEHGRLRQAVVCKLQRHWSPEQIAGWLKRKYPGREDMHVSHETIYKKPVCAGAWGLEEGACPVSEVKAPATWVETWPQRERQSRADKRCRSDQ